MKKFVGMIFLLVFVALLVITNPTRESFDKYFTRSHNNGSGSLTEAVRADIFISRCLIKCEYSDMLIFSIASVPTDNGSLNYMGLLNMWIAVPL